MACAKCNRKKNKVAGVNTLQLPLYTVNVGAWSGEKISVIVQSAFEIQAVRFQKIFSAGTQVKLYPQEYENLIGQDAPIVMI